jgi:hypothetical protein
MIVRLEIELDAEPAGRGHCVVTFGLAHARRTITVELL